MITAISLCAGPTQYTMIVLKPSALVRAGEPQFNSEASLQVFGAKAWRVKARQDPLCKSRNGW
jgi:hypothetical protein